MTLKLPNQVRCWGLTGGIGSGKSKAAEMLRQHGIEVINLDVLGNEILKNDPIALHQIRTQLGEACVVNGIADRRGLRDLIFTDPVKRKTLESILHPRIWNLFEQKAISAAKAGAKLILCEAALLIEHHHANLFPRLIVVLASTETRKKRVLLRDKMAGPLFDEIVRIQTSDTERKKLAHHIILNDGSEEQLRQEVEKCVQLWKAEKIL